MRIAYTAEKAKELFDRHMGAGHPILIKGTGEVYTPYEDEEFRQCYDAQDPVLKDLKPIWFISNYGNLVSVCAKGLTLLPPHYREKDAKDRYGFYKMTNIENGERQNRYVKQHTLTALVFHSTVYGDTARRLLKENGLDAWKRKKGELLSSLDTHHEKLDEENRLKAKFIEITATGVHTRLTSLNRKIKKALPSIETIDEYNKLHAEWMKEITNIAAEEAPGRITACYLPIKFNKKTREVIYDGYIKIFEVVDSDNTPIV